MNGNLNKKLLVKLFKIVSNDYSSRAKKSWHHQEFQNLEAI
jgi:hypothetical protein